MKRFRWVLAACVLSLASCGDSSTGPNERALRVGRYAYTASHGRNDGFTPASFAGVMVVTASTSEDLQVRWEVPSFRPLQGEPRGWNADAYLVAADPEAVGNIIHRISRDGDEVRCSGRRSYIVDRLYSIDVACSLSYVGP